MRIAVDAMGGDHAPAETVRGTVEALQFLDQDSQVVLVGQEQAIRAELDRLDNWQERVEIAPASQLIAMDEVPVDAIRQKRDSSIMRMIKLAARGEVDAIISAGNTGAYAAGCQLQLKTLPGVHRPGIAVVVPSLHGPVVLCDVGANIAAKAHHLHQYALMCSVYARHILGLELPRVGVMSIGEENVKGTELVKQAGQLIRDDRRVNFVGNVEGRDLFRDTCDVIISDGFVGNIVLKLTEGLAEGLFKVIQRQLASEHPELAQQFQPIIERVWAKHDYSEYGGAPLLGVNGVCIICHGSSNHRAIRNAVSVARRFIEGRVNSVIVEHLGHATQVKDD